MGKNNFVNALGLRYIMKLEVGLTKLMLEVSKKTVKPITREICSSKSKRLPGKHFLGNVVQVSFWSQQPT